MPSGAVGESDSENANLFSSGTMRATPIGVNAAMASPQAAAAANHAAYVGPCSTAQQAAIAVIETRALVGAAISQNSLEP